MTVLLGVCHVIPLYQPFHMVLLINYFAILYIIRSKEDSFQISGKIPVIAVPPLTQVHDQGGLGYILSPLGLPFMMSAPGEGGGSI